MYKRRKFSTKNCICSIFPFSIAVEKTVILSCPVVAIQQKKVLSSGEKNILHCIKHLLLPVSQEHKKEKTSKAPLQKTPFLPDNESSFDHKANFQAVGAAPPSDADNQNGHSNTLKTSLNGAQPGNNLFLNPEVDYSGKNTTAESTLPIYGNFQNISAVPLHSHTIFVPLGLHASANGTYNHPAVNFQNLVGTNFSTSSIKNGYQNSGLNKKKNFHSKNNQIKNQRRSKGGKKHNLSDKKTTMVARILSKMIEDPGNFQNDKVNKQQTHTKFKPGRPVYPKNDGNNYNSVPKPLMPSSALQGWVYHGPYETETSGNHHSDSQSQATYNKLHELLTRVIAATENSRQNINPANLVDSTFHGKTNGNPMDLQLQASYSHEEQNSKRVIPAPTNSGQVINFKSTKGYETMKIPSDETTGL